MFLRWGGVETPMNTMSWGSLLIDINIQRKEHCKTVLLLIISAIIDTYFLKNLKKKKKIKQNKNKNKSGIATQ